MNHRNLDITNVFLLQHPYNRFLRIVVDVIHLVKKSILWHLSGRSHYYVGRLNIPVT